MFRRKKRTNQDFSNEIQAHIQLEADRLQQEQGLSAEEALGRARRAFGNVTRSSEEFYESSRWIWFDHLAKDVRFALRQMKREPVATAIIVLSLALGIGVNTAIFSLADQALLRALPVEKPSELVQLDWNGPFVGTGMGSVGIGSLIPYLMYKELQASNDVFSGMFASSSWDVHLASGDRAEPAAVEIVTGSYFTTLGVRPTLGRLIDEADDLKPDAHPVAVLSYGYWRNRLGGDPGAVGKQVRVNGFPMTVIGVAEQSFHGIDWSMAPAMWVPMMEKIRVTPGWSGLDERRTRFLHVFGRLRPGMTREQAQARLQPWFKAYLRADTERTGWPQITQAQMHEYLGASLDLLPGGRGPWFMRRIIEKPVLILLAGTAMILLLACLNVANLSLARALARRRTIALRTALGASRARVLAEQIVESALLAAVGCAAGALFAPAVIRAMLSFMPQLSAGDVALSTSLDLRVLAFALVATAVAAILSGAAPALYAASVHPIDSLKTQSTSVAGGLAFRKTLVVGQFALALLLLVGAGLFARTLATLRAQGPGFPTANLLMFRLAPSEDGYDGAESKLLFRRVLARVQSLPEVERAGLARWEMLRAGGWDNPVTIVSHRRFVTRDSIAMNAVTPAFFDTIGVAVTRGRMFTEADSTPGEKWALRSAIVNQEFVRQYFQGDDPVGARLGIGDQADNPADLTIVGVVSNFHDHDLREPRPQVYFPLWERSVDEGTFYVRWRGSADSAARSIRAVVREMNAALPVLSLRTLDDQLDRMLTLERMLATLAGGFAAVATVLSMIGLYGILSFSAGRRTKEIGIRLALGARPWSARGLILKEAALLAFAGGAIALPASWVLGRLVESQLYGVRPMDLTTIMIAGVILAFVCLAASAVPARRAGSISPMNALRDE